MNNDTSSKNAAWTKKRKIGVVERFSVSLPIIQISKFSTQIAYPVLVGCAFFGFGRILDADVSRVETTVQRGLFARKLQVHLDRSLQAEDYNLLI